MEFETERLRIRGWSGAHPASALRPVLTPAVLAHLPSSLQEPGPERWISARLSESEVLAVIAEDTLIGVVILAGQDPVHLGYLLAEAAWGKGYARELVRGLVSAMPKATLHAGVARDNPASARVLEKAGFNVLEADSEMAMYQLKRGPR